ncbi:DUF2267 domain-containing protein [Antarcticibacterium sp. 1MA-6-2]|uniref:DUF2267 domain-containing protein n=1 Tax=Antarcticibacterium sp. 1MA-6-2 TaxID=2908210 RepID=UPI001F371A44|nr:DUF2267 domain-containing protein [Antarcticibacterium sp. 1MA-6-2]UJH89809.1 DUF2267 domain-containing protein [Antarcticibacterium sp. 1MA-6-2]
MDKVVKMVAERAGISESQARTAVNTVASFLKDRLPAGIAGQVDNYLKDDGAGGSAGAGGDLGGMAGKIGGMFGKK